MKNILMLIYMCVMLVLGIIFGGVGYWLGLGSGCLYWGAELWEKHQLAKAEGIKDFSKLSLLLKYDCINKNYIILHLCFCIMIGLYANAVDSKVMWIMVGLNIFNFIAICSEWMRESIRAGLRY